MPARWFKSDGLAAFAVGVGSTAQSDVICYIPLHVDSPTAAPFISLHLNYLLLLQKN